LNIINNNILYKNTTS